MIFIYFHSRKCIWIRRLRNGGHLTLKPRHRVHHRTNADDLRFLAFSYAFSLKSTHIPPVYSPDASVNQQWWKSFNRYPKSTKDSLRPKIVIHDNECIISFLTRYFMSRARNSAKNNYRPLISSLTHRTVFSDLALWRQYSWSVTSPKRQVLAFWHHICRLFLEAQIGAKSSLMNNNREYRFLIIRYPRLSVYENITATKQNTTQKSVHILCEVPQVVLMIVTIKGIMTAIKIFYCIL